MSALIQPTASVNSDQFRKPLEVYRPALGEWCLIKAKAQKYTVRYETVSVYQYDHRIKEWASVHLEKPIKAMYIGARVVQNTTVEYDGDGYPDPIPQRYLYVWLFVDSERRAPFYVFPLDVERLTGGAE